MDGDAKPSVDVSSVAEAIGLLATGGFLVSIVYDWGFLRLLGLSFSDVTTSLADHFRTGLLWFPAVAASALFYFALEFQIQRFEKGLTEEEIISSSPDPEKTRRDRERPYRFLALICVFAVFTYIVVGEVFAAIPVGAFAVVWFLFAAWCYESPLIQLRRSRAVQLAFYVLPAVLIVAYFTGRNDALNAAFRMPRPVAVSVVGASDDLKGTYLRPFDQGMLVLLPDSRVSFVAWSDVRSYAFSEGLEPYRGLLCTFGGICPELP
jgi:hypothetical protein